MKKIILITLILMLCITSFTACANVNEPNTDLETEGDITTDIDAETDDSGKNIGGYVACSVHHQDYHSIPFSLIKYIGEDEFYEWTELDEGKELLEGCRDNKTIYDCIHYFDIPRSVLEEIYYDTEWDSTVWDVDALCSEDKSNSDEFYRNVEYIDSVHLKRIALSNVKTKIARENWDEWTALHGNYVPSTKHSMKYIVELLDVSRDELEAYIKEIGAEITYEYDLDALYPAVQAGVSVNTNSVNGNVATELLPIEEDALFCGFDDLYIE